ncbi:inositol monophosphatase family protein [soil metagenome]
MVTSPPPPDELDVAIDAARIGAAVVQKALGTAITAEFKSDANPVTIVDQEAEAAIVEVISRWRPMDSVLAEEGGGSGWDQGRVWIIDPLDGTVNFIHAIPHISVSVALWIDGHAEVGVVLDVGRSEEFTARRGDGAWLNQTRLSVSTEAKLAASLVATGFPYDRNIHGRTYAAVLGEVLTRVQGIRRFGSAALDLAWVACGRFEGYWESGIQPWDAAAGVLLVAEAGGTVTDLHSLPHRLDAPVIVASNGRIHNELLDAIISE